MCLIVSYGGVATSKGVQTIGVDVDEDTLRGMVLHEIFRCP